jgi:hypothetical protein
VVFILAGGTTWALVQSELSEQRITVSDDAPFLAGDHVNGPFSAYAEAEVIDMHAKDATEGRTYAELGGLVRQAQADGDEELAEELQAQRTTVMNGSFLRASLFTSVVAFGVSALVIGLGVILVLQGLAFNRLAKAGRGAGGRGARARLPGLTRRARGGAGGDPGPATFSPTMTAWTSSILLVLLHLLSWALYSACRSASSADARSRKV